MNEQIDTIDGNGRTSALIRNFLLLAGFILLYILPLGVRPLVMPDESRYAEIPREMIASGDWMVPRLNGLRYFEKPVLGYWLNAVAMKCFGENTFATRLPAALATGLTALIIFLLTAGCAGPGRTAWVATAVFLTSIEVFCLGVFSTLDSLVTFFLTGALASFFWAWHNREMRKTFYLWLTVSGIFCGLACWTKGFLGLAVPLMVIVPFLVWQKEWRTAGKTIVVLTVLTILVLLPWGLVIQMREPDFWRFFIWNEHIRRFVSDDAQHKQTFFYFFLVLPLGFYPWGALLPAAVKGLAKQPLPTPFFRFILCWLLVPFLFFSASSGKLATYVLPCFPPLAILTAAGIGSYLRSGKTALFNGGLWVLMGLSALLITALAAIQTGVLKDSIAPIETGQAALLFTALALAASFQLAAIAARRPEKKAYLLIAAPLIFFFALQFFTPASVANRKAPVRFFQKYADTIPRNSLLVATHGVIRTVCWSFKRDDVLSLNGGGELRYGLSWPDAAHRQLTSEQFSRLVAENRKKRPVVLVMKNSRYRRWKASLPAPGYIYTNGDDGFIIAVYGQLPNMETP